MAGAAVHHPLFARFYEHVRAPEPRTARWQHAVDRAFWPHAIGVARRS